MHDDGAPASALTWRKPLPTMIFVMLIAPSAQRRQSFQLLAVCVTAVALLGGCFDFSGQSENEVRFNFTGRDSDQPIQCLEDAHCGVRTICVRNLCVQGCRSNADCPSGESCAGEPALCRSNLECRTDNDCAGEFPICHPSLSLCVTCLGASDCAEDQVCLIAPECFFGERRCSRADYSCGLCTRDSDCVSGLCDEPSGRCVECNDDTQCSALEVCDPDLGKCTECVTGDDCLPPTTACLRTPNGGQCVLCASDEDCGEGTCNRDTLSCEGCRVDSDCRDPGLRCNPASGLCWDDACAYRDLPELLELRVEFTRAMPFLAGPLALGPIRDEGEGPNPLASAQILAVASPPDGLGVAAWAHDEEVPLWTTSSALGAGLGVALGDVAGDGRTDAVVLRGGRLTAFNATGSPLWTSGSRTANLPGLFDVDLDAFPEIVAGGSLFSEIGNRVWVGAAHQGGHLALGLPGVGVAADLLAAPGLEVVAGGTVYTAVGEVACTQGADGYTAIADLTGDGSPELVVVSADGSVRALTATCELLWGPVQPAGDVVGGGPPTIGDFDGDLALEVAFVAGDSSLSVVERDGVTAWVADLASAHMAAGVSSSDLDGDGILELLVSDVEALHVFRGTDGLRLTSMPEGAARRPIAAPLVADIDRDSAAEIVVAAGDGTADDRIVVFGDVRDRWTDARNVWNQAAYFVANIQDDMTVPTPLGSFWQEGVGVGVQPVTAESEPAPNLRIRRIPGAVEMGDCPDRFTIAVGVFNRGSRSVPAGVQVETAAPGNPNASLSAVTTRRLDPGDEEILVLTFDDLVGRVDVEATVSRDAAEEVALPECETDDNVLVLEDLGCPDPF